MPSPTATILAIDGRTASPAMAAALEAIDRNCREAGARKAQRQGRIDGDRRVIARREAKHALEVEYRDGMEGAFMVFADMAAGRLARRSLLASLIRARTALLDGDFVAARQFVRDATFARHQHWTVTRLQPDMVVLEDVTINREAPSDPVAGAANLAGVA